jgi:hypothetical protein
MARMDLISLGDILAAARRLPRKAQTDLATALLHESAAAGAAPSGPPPLEPLLGMSDTELRALANAVLAPGHQRRLKALVRKNTEGKLRDQEQSELDSLLEESDRVALLKARAAYTLARAGLSSAAAA